MIKLYHFPLSGHAHRIQLFLSLIGQPFELVHVDLAKGEQKSADFLAVNPAGKVPAIDDDGHIVSDSHAILVYLALKYAEQSWYPRDAVGAAEVQRWLATSASDIASGPASARLVNVFGATLDHARAKSIAEGLFGGMERHLKGRHFLVGDGPTIADVAGYSYIAHAPEGGVSLQPYANLRAWLARIEALPGFIAMPATKVGLAA